MERDVLVAPLLQCGRADHHRRRMCELRDERRERRLERDARRVVVDRLDLRDVVVVKTVALQFVFGVGDAIETHLDGVGLEIGSVVKLDALLELDRVDQPILAGFVAFRQHRNQLHVLVEAEEAFVKRFGHGLGQRVVGVVGVGCSECGRNGEDNVLRGECRRGGERAKCQRDNDQGTKRRFHDSLPAIERRCIPSTPRRRDAWRRNAPDRPAQPVGRLPTLSDDGIVAERTDRTGDFLR